VTRGEIAFAIISGLVVSETTDICPWVAFRLVRGAARLRYPHDPERAASRGEELAALVNDRPGKLFKLFTALGFVLHALTVAGLRTRSHGIRRLGASLMAFASDRTGVARVVLRARAAAAILAGGGLVGLVGVWATSWVVSGVGLGFVVIGAVALGTVIRTLDLGNAMGVFWIAATAVVGVTGGVLSRETGYGGVLYMVLTVCCVALTVLAGVSVAMLTTMTADRLGSGPAVGDLNDR
jgi:hypothetical protein